MPAPGGGLVVEDSNVFDAVRSVGINHIEVPGNNFRSVENAGLFVVQHKANYSAGLLALDCHADIADALGNLQSIPGENSLEPRTVDVARESNQCVLALNASAEWN